MYASQTLRTVGLYRFSQLGFCASDRAGHARSNRPTACSADHLLVSAPQVTHVNHPMGSTPPRVSRIVHEGPKIHFIANRSTRSRGARELSRVTPFEYSRSAESFHMQRTIGMC